MIVRGFLRVDIEGLPPQLVAELQRAIKLAEKEAPEFLFLSTFFV